MVAADENFVVAVEKVAVEKWRLLRRLLLMMLNKLLNN